MGGGGLTLMSRRSIWIRVFKYSSAHCVSEPFAKLLLEDHVKLTFPRIGQTDQEFSILVSLQENTFEVQFMLSYITLLLFFYFIYTSPRSSGKE